MTGSYHNYFRIFDTDNTNDIVLQADKSAFKVGDEVFGLAYGGAVSTGPFRTGLRVEPLISCYHGTQVCGEDHSIGEHAHA